jgi:hypothetical protein
MARVKRWFKRRGYAGSDGYVCRNGGRTENETDQTMSLVAALLTPLALLLPTAGAVDIGREAGDVPAVVAEADANRLALPEQPPLPSFDASQTTVYRRISQSYEVRSENQVRIEERVTIRISPRPAPPPSVLIDLPNRAPERRASERDMGRCLPISGIAGVQVGGDDRLLLFMRDRRIVSAALERACRARDFYSGFYVERNADGMMCVNRDTLRSRSGATCRLSRIRQMVDPDD